MVIDNKEYKDDLIGLLLIAGIPEKELAKELQLITENEYSLLEKVICDNDEKKYILHNMRGKDLDYFEDIVKSWHDVTIYDQNKVILEKMMEEMAKKRTTKDGKEEISKLEKETQQIDITIKEQEARIQAQEQNKQDLDVKYTEEKKIQDDIKNKQQGVPEASGKWRQSLRVDTNNGLYQKRKETEEKDINSKEKNKPPEEREENEQGI